MNMPMNKSAKDHIVDATSAFLQSFPYTGGLAKYLDEYYPNLMKRQIEYLAEELRTQALRVDNVSCNIETLQSLISTVLHQSLMTSSAYKRERFSLILVNYASGKSVDNDTLDTLVYCLAGLTELQIRMLNFGRAIPDEWDEYIKSEYYEAPISKYFTNYPEGIVMSSLYGLIEKGLVKPHNKDLLPLYERNLNVYRLRPTVFGHLLIEWIKKN